MRGVELHRIGTCLSGPAGGRPEIDHELPDIVGRKRRPRARHHAQETTSAVGRGAAGSTPRDPFECLSPGMMQLEDGAAAIGLHRVRQPAEAGYQLVAIDAQSGGAALAVLPDVHDPGDDGPDPSPTQGPIVGERFVGHAAAVRLPGLRTCPT